MFSSLVIHFSFYRLIENRINIDIYLRNIFQSTLLKNNSAEMIRIYF